MGGTDLPPLLAGCSVWGNRNKPINLLKSMIISGGDLCYKENKPWGVGGCILLQMLVQEAFSCQGILNCAGNNQEEPIPQIWGGNRQRGQVQSP